MDTAILTLSVVCAFLAACLVAAVFLAFSLAKVAIAPLVLAAEERVLSSRRTPAVFRKPAPDYDDDERPAPPRVTVPPVAPKSLWSDVPGGVDPFKRNGGEN